MIGWNAWRDVFSKMAMTPRSRWGGLTASRAGALGWACWKTRGACGGRETDGIAHPRHERRRRAAPPTVTKITPLKRRGLAGDKAAYPQSPESRQARKRKTRPPANAAPRGRPTPANPYISGVRVSDDAMRIRPRHAPLLQRNFWAACRRGSCRSRNHSRISEMRSW